MTILKYTFYAIALTLILSCEKEDTPTPETPEYSDTTIHDTLPSDSLPQDSLPQDSLPQDSLPSDSIPSDTTIDDTVVNIFHDYYFFVGTYTSGESEGIYKYKIDKNGALTNEGLAGVCENPSFITFSQDFRFLVAVNENSTGYVETFSIATDLSLTSINRTATDGGNPCYVATNNEGYVVVSNYGSGNVSLFKMDNSGQISDILDSEQHSSDEYPTPHAHSTQFIDGGNQTISADLGINELWFSAVNTTTNKLEAYKQRSLMMPEGSGPRHFVIHPNGKWIYVVNEYGNNVTLINNDVSGNYSVVKSFSTLPNDFTGKSYCADIHISNDQKYLYASNRGHNSIAVFKIDDTNGNLEILEYESTKGEFPRNFAISPDDNYLLAANQNSDNIISLKRDKNTGLLEYVDEIDAPIPVCILFYPETE